MNRIFETAFIITCVFAVVVSAQKKDTERDPCKDPMSQFDNNLCSRRESETADAEMNMAYKRLLQELSGFKSDHRPKFREAQLLWRKYRDANCESEASVYEGGTIRPTIYYSCLASITRERANRLKAFFVEIRGE
jgi:uncharacterized protein YecT (DUF1311 family)